MLIFLVGYMGSGKTTFGAELAKSLGIQWIDLDGLIEQQAGISVARIIVEVGEVTFRELERETLLGLSHGANAVISTGGGTPCFYQNMEVMKSSGIVIYLKCSAAQLAFRLKDETVDRPLLRGLSGPELENHIVNQLSQREKFYSQAHIIVDGNQSTTSEVITRIKSQSK